MTTGFLPSTSSPVRTAARTLALGLACALDGQSSDHLSAKTLVVPREPGDCQPRTVSRARPLCASLTAPSPVLYVTLNLSLPSCPEEVPPRLG